MTRVRLPPYLFGGLCVLRELTTTELHAVNGATGYNTDFALSFGGLCVAVAAAGAFVFGVPFDSAIYHVVISNWSGIFLGTLIADLEIPI